MNAEGDTPHGAGASDQEGSAREFTDETLVERVRRGDEDAARELFDRNVAGLRARVRRRLPAAIRQKVAESDVIQEAYIAAFLNIGDFEERGEHAFQRWLATILEHRILDEVRRFAVAKKRDLKREQALSEARPPADKDPSVSTMAVDAEERAALWQAIDRLAPDYQTILRLVHEEGLSLVESAARMDRSPDAVRKLYSRALARLSEGVAGSGAASDGD